MHAVGCLMHKTFDDDGQLMMAYATTLILATLLAPPPSSMRRMLPKVSSEQLQFYLDQTEESSLGWGFSSVLS